MTIEVKKYKESIRAFKRIIKECCEDYSNKNVYYLLLKLYESTTNQYIKKILYDVSIQYIVGMIQITLNKSEVKNAENHFYKLLRERYQIKVKNNTYDTKIKLISFVFNANKHHYSNNIMLFMPNALDWSIWWDAWGRNQRDDIFKMHRIYKNIVQDSTFL